MPLTRPHRRQLLLLAAAGMGRALLAQPLPPPPKKVVAGDTDWLSKYATLDREWADKLRMLAGDVLELKTEYARLFPPADPDRNFLPALDYVPPRTAEKSVTANWQDSIRNAAGQWWQLGVSAVNAGDLTTAWRAWHRALQFDSQHKSARLILGYELSENGWVRPAVARKLKAGWVDHSQFGWLPAEHVKQYEGGSRYYRGKWISADQDAQLQSTLQNARRIESPHYTVRTNDSHEVGVELTRRLECLLEIWQQLYPAYFTTATEVRARLAAAAIDNNGSTAVGKPWLWQTRRYEVVLAATRTEYNDALRAAQPNIEQTLGIYFARTKTAYFFAGKEQDPGTLWHEATHQLFQETQPTSLKAGEKAGFWLLEAVACYSETLTATTGGTWSGGADAIRVKAARQRLLKDGYYVPVAELNGLGMNALQQRADLPKLYSQAAGLWQFLMHGVGGAYREPALQALQLLYADKLTARPLTVELNRLLRADDGTIDREYRRYLEQFDTP